MSLQTAQTVMVFESDEQQTQRRKIPAIWQFSVLVKQTSLSSLPLHKQKREKKQVLFCSISLQTKHTFWCPFSTWLTVRGNPHCLCFSGTTAALTRCFPPHAHARKMHETWGVTYAVGGSETKHLLWYLARCTYHHLLQHRVRNQLFDWQPTF